MRQTLTGVVRVRSPPLPHLHAGWHGQLRLARFCQGTRAWTRLEIPLEEVLLFFCERQTGPAMPHPLFLALTVGMIPGAVTATDDHEVTDQPSAAAGSLGRKGYSSCQPSLPWA